MQKKTASPRPVVTTIKQVVPGWAERTPSELCRLLERESIAKLSFNESPYGPSPKAVEAMREAACRTHLYHDMEAKDLRQSIAERFGLTLDHVYVGNGGDEAIALLVNAFVSPGDEVVMPWPTFGQYGAAATIMDGIPVKVPVRSDDLKADLEAMLAAITSRTKIVFLCNPNNPTGVEVDGEELRSFLTAVPAHVLVGIDEAYAEFVTEKKFVSGIDLLKDFANIVVVRTFSKIFGLAGMRVGYGIARPEIVEMVQRVRPLFNVNNLAQAGAMAALEDTDFVKAAAENNAAERLFLTEELGNLGWRVVPSQTNFLFADTGKDAAAIADAARAEGIVIRSGGGWGFPGFLRISLGTHEQNEALLAVLKKAL